LLGAYTISTLTWRQLTIESWDAGGYLRLEEDFADLPKRTPSETKMHPGLAHHGDFYYGFII
jgi:hypothetical protein